MSRIKVYLDTNMILDVFTNHAIAVKKKSDVIVPKKYEFMLSNKDKLEFVTSFITKAEVARELASGFDLDKGEIEKLWSELIEDLNCTFVSSFTFDARIADIAAETKMKIRTLFNFMHLFIAIDRGCYFVSGDNDLIEKTRALNIYNKTMDYIELRKLIGGVI